MPQIRRASFGHTVSDAVVFARLPHGWIDPRVSGKLCRGGKTADVSDLAEDVRAKGRADAGDGSDRRVQGVHDLRDLAVHFSNLLFQKIEVLRVKPDHHAENVAGHGEAKGIARKLLKLLGFCHAEALVAGDFDEMAELLKRHLG